jgi:hypothetical protein
LVNSKHTRQGNPVSSMLVVNLHYVQTADYCHCRTLSSMRLEMLAGHWAVFDFVFDLNYKFFLLMKMCAAGNIKYRKANSTQEL